MVYQDSFTIKTAGRGTIEISDRIDSILRSAKINSGICNIFIQHTSASLILCENADPAVRTDLETFMSRLVRDGDADFQHKTEGPDDMPAHIRSILTDTGLTIPVSNGHLALGTWQGIYLYEHRISSCHRQVIVTFYGD
jgi:secondary thiamine-phosphate synthase enzyme